MNLKWLEDWFEKIHEFIHNGEKKAVKILGFVAITILFYVVSWYAVIDLDMTYFFPMTIVFAFVAYVLSVVNTFCVEKFRAKLGPEIVNVIIETDQRESSEFLSRYVNIGILNSSISLIILLLLQVILHRRLKP